MAGAIRIPNRKVYDKYDTEIREKKWTNTDYKAVLDSCKEDLAEDTTNRSTLINILIQNSVLAHDDQDSIESERTEKARNMAFYNRIRSANIRPCLPLLLATMDARTMPHLSEMIWKELLRTPPSGGSSFEEPETIQHLPYVKIGTANATAAGAIGVQININNGTVKPGSKNLSVAKRIAKNLPYLTANLIDVGKVCLALVAAEILSIDGKERVMKRVTTADQGDELFSVLMRKDLDEEGLEELLTILEENGNEHLVDKLRNTN